MPFPSMLSKPRITDETGFQKHDVSGLKDALKMGGVLLDQRQHVAEPLE